MNKAIAFWLLVFVSVPFLVSADDKHKNVAILIFDGVQIIDYSAPYEVFGQAHYNVYTVAEKAGPITANMNLSLNPTYDFSNAPKADVLLLPGGRVTPVLEKAAVIDWIKKSSADAQYVLTVCNGAFFAAKAGLLDGLTATTFHGMIRDLQEFAPKAHVVRNKRYVDNGKIITSAGLTSGMDSSLYLVSKIDGLQRAKELALNLEYNWDPDSKYARAEFADRYLDAIQLDLPSDSGWKVLKNYGDMNHWEYSAAAQKPVREVLFKTVNDQLQAAKWKLKSSAANQSIWSFNGDDGKPWNGSVRVEPGPDQSYTVTFHVDRAS